MLYTIVYTRNKSKKLFDPYELFLSKRVSTACWSGTSDGSRTFLRTCVTMPSDAPGGAVGAKFSCLTFSKKSGPTENSESPLGATKGPTGKSDASISILAVCVVGLTEKNGVETGCHRQKPTCRNGVGREQKKPKTAADRQFSKDATL
jgi:hypothetical protein